MSSDKRSVLQRERDAAIALIEGRSSKKSLAKKTSDQEDVLIGKSMTIPSIKQQVSNAASDNNTNNSLPLTDFTIPTNSSPLTTPNALADPISPRSRQALDASNARLSQTIDSQMSLPITANSTLSPDKAIMNFLDSTEYQAHILAAKKKHATEYQSTPLIQSTIHTITDIESNASTYPIGNNNESKLAQSISSSLHSGASLPDYHINNLTRGLHSSGIPSQVRGSNSLMNSSNFSFDTINGSTRSKDKKYAICGSDILYGTLIRLRLNNHECLRVSAKLVHTKEKGKKPLGGIMNTHIDISGDGLGGDDDQIFVFINGNMRTDKGEVHYADVVAIYCVAGSCKGRFLSVDRETGQLTTKKGPVISNAEKWKILNPSVPKSLRRDDQDVFFDTSFSTSSSRIDPPANGIDNSSNHEYSQTHWLWEQQKVVMTSDKVLLKMYSADKFLSASNDSTSKTSLMLEMENDSENIQNSCRQYWEITKSNIPYDPNWNRERPYLNGYAKVKEIPASKLYSRNLPPLSTFPPSVQEKIMLDDLLFTLLGYRGRYINLETREVENSSTYYFTLKQQNGMDPSIAAMTTRCMALGAHYLNLSFYVETYSRYEYGQVHHAFAAALKSLMKEYTIVIGQLEHQLKTPGSPFTLQKLWFYIQPSMRTMEMLAKLVDACRQSIGGGSLLTAIQQVQSSLAGDKQSRQVFTYLLERASIPYLAMVEKWLYYGKLEDPYDEFMIKRDADVSQADVQTNPYSTYWQDGFTLRQSQVPLFLARFAQKILTAGKYLHVFRTCPSSENKKSVQCPFAATLPFSTSDAIYEPLIDRAHSFASQTLVKFFLEDQNLMQRLHSLKHYFLMDQGDFFVDFMDVAHTELNLRADKLSISRLESLLHLSLSTSTCALDIYKDDLTCFLSPHNLIAQMEAIHERAQKKERDDLTPMMRNSLSHPGYKVIDAFTLNYSVKWPLTLIISGGALSKYQMIFRHLFFCKHVEKRLCDAWLTHQTTKELSLRSALGPSFCLRQRMLHFQQNFVYYMMFEVISPRWHSLEIALRENVETVDDILEAHGDFLDICMKECLLTDPELLRVLTKLMTVCMTFANSIEAFTQPYFLDEETIKAEREAERDRRAENRAREEAEAAIQSFHLRDGKNAAVKKNKKNLVRRPSSQVDMRRGRIKELSEDMKRAITDKDVSGNENPFARMTKELDLHFDKLLGEFLQQLLRRSLLQQNSHLSNLCTRLDYNGFYTR